MSTSPASLHEVQPDGFFTRGLADADPAVFGGVQKELAREQHQIELIASENIVSRAVLEAQGSVFTNKYAEGYPGKRYYQGCAPSDEVEQLAIDRARQLFNCGFANVQPHSGAQANGAVMLALTKPGDTIMGLSLDAGGHLTHGAKAALSGKWYNAVQYGVRADDHLIDFDQVEALAREHKPKLIITGGSAYPRHIDFARFRAIADEVGALFMVDMAHVAGLVASGLYPHPFPHAHVVTSTTYKSLRGARGGLVLWNDAGLSDRINYGIFPGVQGSVMMHAVAGKAACFGEALRPEFTAYNLAVLENARVLADTLAHEGVRIVGGGTDCGLMLADLSETGTTGDVAAKALEKAGLAVNKNLIPFDARPPEAPSGLRLSSNAGTARGLGIAEFQTIGGWIARIVKAPADEAGIAGVGAELRALCARFPIYG